MKNILVALSVTALFAAVTIPAAAAGQTGRSNPRAGDPFDWTLLSGTGSIGVSVRDVTADDVRRAKLPDATGAVATVADGSEAARAGFQNGDIVVEFDGERVRSARQFARLVQESPVGRAVKAIVVRDGSRRTIEVTPRARNLFAFAEPLNFPELRSRVEPFARSLGRELGNLERVAPDTFTRPQRLGATLTALDEQLGSYFGSSTGVLVLSVAPRSAAEAAGLKGGDVITAVNGRGVRRPVEVSEAIRDAGNGERIELKVLREKKETTLTTTIQ